MKRTVGHAVMHETFIISIKNEITYITNFIGAI